MRVLLVDDYHAIARTLQRLFLRAGHDTALAGNAEHALEIAKEFSPDVLVTDISLPGMDGYDLAKAVKVMSNGAVRVVGLSAYASSASDPRSEDIDVYLTKPTTFKHLLAATMGVAERREAGDTAKNSAKDP